MQVPFGTRSSALNREVTFSIEFKAAAFKYEGQNFDLYGKVNVVK